MCCPQVFGHPEKLSLNSGISSRSCPDSVSLLATALSAPLGEQMPSLQVSAPVHETEFANSTGADASSETFLTTE